MEAFIQAFLEACPQPPTLEGSSTDAAATAAAAGDATSSPSSSSASGLAARPALKQAAVLVGVFEHPEESPGEDGQGRLHVLLTVRSKRLRKHAGEVCFPGGKVDDGDADVAAAALREAQEEIGLHPSEVRVIGQMTPTLSLHLLEVHPVLAVIPADFTSRARPNPEEVDHVFSMPLRVIMSPPRGMHSYQDLDWFLPWRMHTFVHDGQDVWGLTAETLVRLCVLVRPSHPFPYDPTHPDGRPIESWFSQVVALREFRLEVERVARERARGGDATAASRRRKKSS